MDTIREIGRRLRALFTRARIEQDLDEEMRTHLALREERLRADGTPAGEVRLAARRRFGNMRRLRDEGIDAWGWRWLEQWHQDLRFGGRMLLKSPVLSAVGILTLALATGASTVIFSILNGVVLRPLPFGNPDQLVQVYGRNWSADRGGAPDAVRGPVHPADLEAFVTASRSFSSFSAYSMTTQHLEGPSGTQQLAAASVDGNLFATLDVQPALGRTFSADDPRNVVVISRRLWQEYFGGDPSLPGRAVRLDGQIFTIIGVMPGAFQFPYSAASVLPGALPESRTDLWVPMEPLRALGSPDLRRGRSTVVARLKPGVTVEEGAAELRLIGARVEAGTSPRRLVGVRIEPLREVVIGRVAGSLWMLFAAVALVLGAACANMACLLLARLTLRTKEVLTRAALGASRTRLIRQFMAESLLLSLAGGLLGLALAHWGTAFLVATASPLIPRAHEVRLDWQAFVFLLFVCGAAALLFGSTPAVLAARMDVSSLTREAGGTATAGRRFARLRDALVVLEVTLAFVLAVGASLMVRETVHLRRVNPGMNVDNVVVLHVTPRLPVADYYAIEERVQQLPAVAAGGFIQLVPLQNWGWLADFAIPGTPRAAGERRTAELRYVTPGYFEAAGIPLRAGRAFSRGDIAGAPAVLLVNEALVRRYFPNEDPVGRALDRGTIVGVIGDVRNVALDRPAEPEIYYPAAQNVAMTSDLGMSLMVRAAGPPLAMVPSIRAAVLSVNPKLAISNVRTMRQVVEDSMWELNVYRWLIGLFALLTLVLATIGLYGVITYMSSARMQEFAIRRALGSNRAALGQLVLRRGLVLTTVGLASGGAFSWLAGAAWRTLPVGSGPDLSAYAVVAAILLAVALLACAIPAWRSAAVDPMAPLKQG